MAVEDAPVRRSLWVCAVAVLTVALAVVPVADHRLAVHSYLMVAFLVLMVAGDLLTAHLLRQQFLAGGRLATLGLSSAYLYSALVMVVYAVVSAKIQRAGVESTWAEVCGPWLFLAVLSGFPLLVATLSAGRSGVPRTRRRIVAAAATVAVLTLTAAVAGTVVAGAGRLPRIYQGGTPTEAGRWAVCVALVIAAAGLLTVIRNLRHRPRVEQWVVVALSASLATTILFLAGPQRYTLGYYVARVTMLVSSGVVLLALLAETAHLYRRLSAAHEDLDHAHRELSRRAEDLEAAGAWKSDIIATLTHEINQPLAVISAYSEELTQEWDTTTDSERRAAVQALGNRVDQLLDMAAHLLALCRAEPGEIRTEPVAVPVEKALARATDNLTKQARTRVTVGPAPPGAAVWADPVHLHEVLTNFITNAVKYSPGGIHVSAALDSVGAEVRFAVTDEGNGVPPDFVEHLFDRFTQAEQPGEARTGAGFGLYLSRLLAEANHGQVWYEAVVPHGSRFLLRLPCAQRHPSLRLVDGDLPDEFSATRQ
ncbi:ATP-binding protein [Actinoplanes sp. NPDC023936]|uniref:sensor histidine kinase n=1 Tax=Actinoplanes sp. NPDC023936 TaxID=3154910 RepID=UPI0033CBB8B8